MHIHFVCRGNVFRSRLAETYLRSKQITGITVSSSGTVVKDNLGISGGEGPISWWSERLIEYHDLIPYMTMMPQQTTKELLEKADLVIFMEKECYQFSVNTFGADIKEYEDWEIADLRDMGFFDGFISMEDEIKKIEFTEKDFAEIKRHVDDLVKRIKLQ